MASALFNAAREGFLSGEIDWDTATLKVSLVRGYTFNAAHKFVSDLTTGGGALVATATLSGKTVAGGVADAADPTFTAVPSGAAIPALVIYQASAATGGADVAATAQRLIFFTDSYSNLPITPNGGDISVAFDNGANRIFAL